MHEITDHCAYLFCLNSVTFWFSCKDDYYVNEEKHILNYQVIFTVLQVVWPTLFTVALSLPCHFSCSFIKPKWINEVFVMK